MDDLDLEAAQLSRVPGAVQARFDLLLDEHVERVWDFLTRSDLLPLWLAPGHIDLTVAGKASLDFGDSGVVVDSTVTAVEPKKLLEYSWSGASEPLRPVRWTLDSQGPVTAVSLSLQIPESENAARAFAGWAAHLEMLVAALAGVPIKFPFAAFKAAQARLADQLSRVPADALP